MRSHFPAVIHSNEVDIIILAISSGHKNKWLAWAVKVVILLNRPEILEKFYNS